VGTPAACPYGLPLDRVIVLYSNLTAAGRALFVVGVMRKPLLKFAGEDQERDFWGKHDSTAYLDWKKAKRLSLPNLKPSLKRDRELKPTRAK